MRAELSSLAQSAKDKDARYKELLKHFKEMKNEEKRSTYTAKILALVSTVKKYRVEINAILIDTKIVQKEINALSDTLSRSFADTEQLIFDEVERDKDKPTTESYKCLAKLDTIFKEMVDLISKTGAAQNQTLQLSDKINKLETRTTTLNIERINQDMADVKQENEALIEQIQAAMSKVKKEKREKK